MEQPCMERRAKLLSKTGTNLMDKSSLVCFKARVFLHGQMVLCIKVSLTRIASLGREDMSGLMNPGSRVML